MVDQNQGMDVSRLRQIVDNSVVERDGKFTIQWTQSYPIQGIDLNRTYDTKEEATTTLFDALKRQNFKAA